MSSYRVVPVPDPAGLLAALGETNGVDVVVEKRRRLLLWETVRIHLDEVEGLGSFLELEAVAGPDSDLTRERRQVAQLREALEHRRRRAARGLVFGRGPRRRGDARPGAARPRPRGRGQRLRALLELPRRRRGPHRRRPPLRRRQRRERGLSAGPVRGGLGARRDGRGRRRPRGRGRGCGAEPRRSARPAAAAASACASSPTRTRRSTSPTWSGCAARPRSPSCCRCPSARRASDERARGRRRGRRARRPGSRRGSGSCSAPGSARSPTSSPMRSTIPYADLPGFRVGTVSGHAGALTLGHLDGVPVACLRGRSHVYEGIDGERGHDADPHAQADRRRDPRCSPTRPARCAPRPAPAASSPSPTTSTCRASTRSWGPTTRRSARASRASRAPTTPSCAPSCTRPPTRSARRSTTASTSPSPARASRPRPRSAPSARWAPTSSGCRPCPRRSSPATAACASPRCPWSPTSPRGWATSPSPTSRRWPRASAGAASLAPLLRRWVASQA